MGLFTKVSLQLFHPQPTSWHVGTPAIDVCSIDVPLHAHTISKHHSVSPAVHTLTSILKHMCITSAARHIPTGQIVALKKVGPAGPCSSSQLTALSPM